MEFLSRPLSSLLLGLFLLAVPVEAYVPKDPFISELSEARKELIRMGHTAPYNELTVRRVVVGKARIMPNGAIITLPHGPDMVPSFYALQYDPKWQVKKEPDYTISYWSDREKRMIDILFFSAQILDVYSTYRGLKYECITEANPLLPQVPDLTELIGLKLVVIGGFKNWIEADENFWYGWKLGAGMTTGMVTVNNFRLLKKAQKQCRRR
jgi:hypothetical protein